MNSELHGARFVLRDCLREGASKFTKEYLARSEDYDAKISNLIKERKSSRIDYFDQISPRMTDISEELSDNEDRNFGLLKRSTNHSKCVPFWKANV